MRYYRLPQLDSLRFEAAFCRCQLWPDLLSFSRAFASWNCFVGVGNLAGGCRVVARFCGRAASVRGCHAALCRLDIFARRIFGDQSRAQLRRSYGRRRRQSEKRFTIRARRIVICFHEHQKPQRENSLRLSCVYRVLESCDLQERFDV